MALQDTPTNLVHYISGISGVTWLKPYTILDYPKKPYTISDDPYCVPAELGNTVMGSAWNATQQGDVNDWGEDGPN